MLNMGAYSEPQKKVTLLFFYKDHFGIKESMKADMPLNIETKFSFSVTRLCTE